MALSMQKAFEAAEEQREARDRVMRRTVVDAATRHRRRIEYLEIYASWDRQKLRSLTRILAGYIRDQGLVDQQHSLGSPEDFLQEAITQTLRWPARELFGPLENLVLWHAKRSLRTRFANAVAKREAYEESLQRPLTQTSETTIGDLIADTYCDEDAMVAPIELWYVDRYVRDLLEEGRGDRHISNFLGVRPMVVERLRARLREELEIEDHQKLATGWSRPRCMKAIRDYAAEHDGYGPNKVALESSGRELPTATTLIRLYGSRRAALEEAGVLLPRRVGRNRLDKVEVSERLVKWVKIHGHWPSAPEIRKASAAGELPSTSGFKSAYGAVSRYALYSGALKTLGRDALAGIEPPPNRYGTILPRKAAEDILRWKEEHGRWPGQPDFRTRDNGLIGVASATSIFGTTKADKVGEAVVDLLNRRREKEAECTEKVAA